MPSETELKYAPPSGFSADALFDDEYIAPYRSEIKSIDMHTDYLDTVGGDAKKQGITLRRRFENGESVIYAKCNRSLRGALTVRGEWSVESSDIENAAALLHAQGAPTEKLSGLPLLICATVSFRRLECLVTPYDGFSFLLSFDDGHFGSDTPFCEVELELCDGTEAELLSFGQKLSAKLDFKPELRSKYARALLYR